MRSDLTLIRRTCPLFFLPALLALAACISPQDPTEAALQESPVQASHTPEDSSAALNRSACRAAHHDRAVVKLNDILKNDKVLAWKYAGYVPLMAGAGITLSAGTAGIPLLVSGLAFEITSGVFKRQYQAMDALSKIASGKPVSEKNGYLMRIQSKVILLDPEVSQTDLIHRIEDGMDDGSLCDKKGKPLRPAQVRRWVVSLYTQCDSGECFVDEYTKAVNEVAPKKQTTPFTSSAFFPPLQTTATGFK